MSKKLKIMGMEFDNYTVWESMFQVEDFLNSSTMNTVETISMETLVKLQTDEQ